MVTAEAEGRAFADAGPLAKPERRPDACEGPTDQLKLADQGPISIRVFGREENRVHLCDGLPDEIDREIERRAL
jgi:hypothetical protein